MQNFRGKSDLQKTLGKNVIYKRS